jgi:quinol monooxygenase YgiN
MIRIVRLAFKDEYRNNFLELFAERKQRIRNANGCTHLELWEDSSNVNVFYTYSIWEENDALDNYRLSELFQETWDTIKPWFADKPMAFSTKQHTIV